MRASKSLVLLLLYAGFAFATPPTPPATVRIDETALMAQRAVLPVRIEIDGVVQQSRLQVSVRPLPAGVAEFARPAPKVIFDQQSVAEVSRTLEVPLSGLAPGEYELDIMLTGSERESQGFADRTLQHLTLSAQGAMQIESMGAWARRQGSQRSVVAVPAAIAARVVGRELPENLREAVQPATEILQPAAVAPGALTVRGRLIFLDIDGVWRPIVNATVLLWDEEFSGAQALASTLSDGQGRWSFVVDNQDGPLEGGRDLFFTAELANSRVRLTQCPGRHRWSSAVRRNLPDSAIVDFGPSTTESGYGAVRVFDTLNGAWRHATVAGGQDPGRVDACYPMLHTRTSLEGRVDVATEDFDSDSIAHEYAHFLMTRATGSQGPVGAHSFNDCNQDPALAWSEGWANAFALSVIPDGVYNFHYLSPSGNDRNLEIAGHWFSACYQGHKSEYRVAAALNDLLDAPDDDNHGTTFAGRDGYGDYNAQARISLAQIFRDTLWGRAAHGDVLSFWNALSPALTQEQRRLGDEILYFNYMPVPEPCVVSRGIVVLPGCLAQHASESPRMP